MIRVARILATIVGSALLIGLLTTLALGVSGRLSGGVITGVRVATPPTADVTSTTYQDLPGGSVTIGVPANSQAIFLARFSAYGVAVGAWTDCAVRIVIGPPSGPFTEMQPIGGVPFVEADASGSGSATSAIDRSHGPIGSGSYVVKAQVQVRSAASGAACSFGGMSLTVERSRA
jgi:hypothetical protein